MSTVAPPIKIKPRPAVTEARPDSVFRRRGLWAEGCGVDFECVLEASLCPARQAAEPFGLISCTCDQRSEVGEGTKMETSPKCRGCFTAGQRLGLEFPESRFNTPPTTSPHLGKLKTAKSYYWSEAEEGRGNACLSL